MVDSEDFTIKNFDITCKVCGSKEAYLWTYTEHGDWYAKIVCANENCDNEDE